MTARSRPHLDGGADGSLRLDEPEDAVQWDRFRTAFAGVTGSEILVNLEAETVSLLAHLEHEPVDLRVRQLNLSLSRH